ncbi:MAG: hypothetical protein ACLGSH_08265 [Acidobacteriota bacterium]
MASLVLCSALLAAQNPPAVLATTTASGTPAAAPDAAPAPAGAAFTRSSLPPPVLHPAPFSRIGFAAGMSTMGIHLEAGAYLTPHLELRMTGSSFGYSVRHLRQRGFLVDGNLAFAAAGMAVDYFPFRNHGLRFSPGMLFYNQSGVNAAINATGKTSFTFNGVTYYSSPRKPVTAIGTLNLHKQVPAFTLSTGWGRMVAPNRHFSFPFEFGVAMIGAPVPNVTFTGGQVCSRPDGTYCGNVVGDPSVEKNLHAQMVKDQRSLRLLRFYPVLSFGVAYSFRVGRRGVSRPPL